uniref:Uncharacterized protein n=1 Tax=Anguilla anguilla TaxID=7936 RepID=A0A0E9UHI5_ANGAN
MVLGCVFPKLKMCKQVCILKIFLEMVCLKTLPMSRGMGLCNQIKFFLSLDSKIFKHRK